MEDVLSDDKVYELEVSDIILYVNVDYIVFLVYVPELMDGLWLEDHYFPERQHIKYSISRQ
jgi:hypothetical protein